MSTFMPRYQTRVSGKNRGQTNLSTPSVGKGLIPCFAVGDRSVCPRFLSSAFVKLAYALIGCAAFVYLAIRLSQGGSLAAAAEMASAGLVFAIGALVVVFGVVVVGSSLRRSVGP
jgi:hypothetical protein